MENGQTQSPVESSLDRFEHEIEELERPMESNKTQWILAILISLSLIGLFVLIGHFKL